jgi:hypothetical protein
MRGIQIGATAAGRPDFRVYDWHVRINAQMQEVELDWAKDPAERKNGL